MSDLQVALAQAGKLKQFCQAVLDVIGAVEQLGPLDAQISETKARLAQYQEQDTRAKAELADAQALIPLAQANAARIAQASRTEADTLIRDTKAAMAKQLDEAKDTVRLSHEARQQLDAEIVLSRQTLAGLKAETKANEVKLIEAKAAITRMLGN